MNDVVKVLQMAPYRPDLTRTKDVRKLIQQINDREMQLALPLPGPTDAAPDATGFPQ